MTSNILELLYKHHGDWDQVSLDSGYSYSSLINTYTDANLRQQELSANQIAYILDILPPAALSWIKKGVFGPSRLTHHPGRTSFNRTKNQGHRILRSNFSLFLRDPYYAWIYQKDRILPSYTDLATSRELYFLDAKSTSSLLNLPFHFLRNWMSKRTIPSIRTPASGRGARATPLEIMDELLDLYPLYSNKQLSKQSVSTILYSTFDVMAARHFDAFVAAPWRPPMNHSFLSTIHLPTNYQQEN